MQRSAARRVGHAAVPVLRDVVAFFLAALPEPGALGAEAAPWPVSRSSAFGLLLRSLVALLTGENLAP